jgi:hypothetical protein
MPSRFRGDSMNTDLQLTTQLPSAIPTVAAAPTVGAAGTPNAANFPGPSGQGGGSPLRRGTDAIRDAMQSIQAMGPMLPPGVPPAQEAAPAQPPPGITLNFGGQPGAGGSGDIQDILRQLISFDPRSLAQAPVAPAPVALPQPVQQVVRPQVSEEQQLLARLQQLRGAPAVAPQVAVRPASRLLARNRGSAAPGASSLVRNQAGRRR